MAPLVIPTRNRPMSIRMLFDYLLKLYPSQRVVVADGSHPSYYSAYDAAVANYSEKVRIEYHRFPFDMPLGNRLIDCVERLNDDIIIVGADDDFPVIDTLNRGAEFLEENEDFIIAIGGIITLSLETDGQFSAKLLQARSIGNPDPVARIKSYINWPYATSYAATRRTHFLDRCKNVDRNGMTLFGDYNVAFHDCLAGKLKALPKIGYFTTKLPTHSRLEKPSRLHYLENASEILGLRDYYTENLTSKLTMSHEEAKALAERMIGKRISYFAGGVSQGQKGFGHSRLFGESAVQGQYKAFHDLFREGSKTRKVLYPNLRHIVESMQIIFDENTDNYGEPERYASLDDMLKPVIFPQNRDISLDPADSGNA